MEKFPLIVINRLEDFSETQKLAYFEEYKRRKKSVFVGYLMMFPLGWHYAYLKKWGLQILCFLTFYGFVIWWLIDWFRIPTLVRRYNQDLSVEILKDFAWVEKKNSEINESNHSKYLPKSANNNTDEDYFKLEEWKKNNPNSTINDFYKSRK